MNFNLEAIDPFYLAGAIVGTLIVIAAMVFAWRKFFRNAYLLWRNPNSKLKNDFNTLVDQSPLELFGIVETYNGDKGKCHIYVKNETSSVIGYQPSGIGVVRKDVVASNDYFKVWIKRPGLLPNVVSSFALINRSLLSRKQRYHFEAGGDVSKIMKAVCTELYLVWEDTCIAEVVSTAVFNTRLGKEVGKKYYCPTFGKSTTDKTRAKVRGLHFLNRE